VIVSLETREFKLPTTSSLGNERELEIEQHQLLEELASFEYLNKPGVVGRQAARRPICASIVNQKTEKVVITVHMF
jgi:hypothetical protein